jgi:hypothetical protein
MKILKSILILLLMMIFSTGCLMVHSDPKISLFCTHDNESDINFLESDN